MAEVALPGRSRHHRQSSSISNIMSGNVALTEPKFEMVPNPTFSFPMLPRTPSPSEIQVGPAPSRRRPMSVHLGVPGAQPTSTNTHRRTTSALPSFSFNADNTSGLQETSIDAPTDAPPLFTPKRGHKRGGSEFVGGDSRLGVSNALSTSPTRATAPDTLDPSAALPVPGHGGKRGHAHRRSAALSSHDVKTIMAPSEESSPGLSASVPDTPSGHRAEEHAAAIPLDRSVSVPEIDSGSGESSPASPGSRRCVGFSENVEIIPRPLSTISSEGSFSTSRNHSVNNSISSVISMGPPPARVSQRSLSAGNMSAIMEQVHGNRSSAETSRRVEREGAWLKNSSNFASEAPALSPSLPSAHDESQIRVGDAQPSRHPVGRTLGFGRRKSEPSISARANEEVSRLSAISLQDDQADLGQDVKIQQAHSDRRSSTKKLKEWAASKLQRRSKDFNKAYPTAKPAARTTTTRPKSEGFFNVPGQVPIAEPQPLEPAAAETDLDAVFGGFGGSGDADNGAAPEPRVQFNTPTFSQASTFRPADDDAAQLVDLDDAMSLQTPPLGSSYRKQLHSATRSNNAPSSYMHRRTESAPVMMPFDFSRSGTPQSSMADVFEEEEEDEQLSPRTTRPHTSHGMERDETAGIGISIVDADSTAMNFGADDVSHPRRNDWEPERPSTSYGPASMGSRLSTPLNERRGSSIMEETIIEEASPVEAQTAGIEIVADHEEPRAPSLTKSSDSSDTPTLLASQREGMFYPDTAPPMMTPETYQTSTFSTSSPGRPRSFDTPRLGTSASSLADNRTVSSSTTGEQPPDVRISVDDIPSLTSSRSTMFSTAHANSSHRDFSGANGGYIGQRNSSGASSTLDPSMVAEQRRKRSSIQSLSQLMGNSFGPKTKGSDEFRPKTASAATISTVKPKKEHRLKKLMFWRSKQSDAQRGSWSSAASAQTTTD